MIEQKVLENLGLSQKQASVYLAMLLLGKSGVAHIAKQAQLKRPTVYVILDELKQKGLVSELPEEGKTIYVAEDPALLEKQVKQNLVDFSEMLPLFRSQYTKETKPSIRYYDDKDVIEQLYYQKIFPAKKIYFYGASVDKINATWPRMLHTWDNIIWPKKKKQKHIVLDIVGNSPEDIAYARQMQSERDVRILPHGKTFHADNAIADNIIMITSFDPLFAVVIESAPLADTYRALVELAWESAIPVTDWKPENSARVMRV